MKDVRDDELFRLSLQPDLTPEESARLEAWLAVQPVARAAWEEDRALGRALQSLPDVPVSSNFTARVMQAVDLEESREERQHRTRFDEWRAFWPRLGWAAVMVLLAVFGVQQYQGRQRAQLAQDMIFVSRELPGPEALRDFDVLESLQQVSPASDDQLLLVLQ